MCEKEVGIPLQYEKVKLDLGFRADLIVDSLVIVELKAVEKVMPVHKKQLITYLRLTELKLGLLVNFNVNLIKDGIERVVNGLCSPLQKDYGFLCALCGFARYRCKGTGGRDGKLLSPF